MNNHKWTKSDAVKTLAPENVIVNKVYTFSYNPNCQPARSPSEGKFRLNMFKCWGNDFMKIFESCKNSKISLRLEISRKGRFHFHGTIVIKNVIQFYVHDLPKLTSSGTLEIDEISDIDVWDNYCAKQMKLTKPWCNQENMPYYYQTELISAPQVESLDS